MHVHSQCEFRTLWQDTSVCIIVILRPHRSTVYVDAAYYYRPSSVVCRSVGWSAMIVSPAKTAEPVKMPCRFWTQVGLENHGMIGVQITPCEGAVLGEMICQLTCHSWRRQRHKSAVGTVVVLSPVGDECIGCREGWQGLANMIQPSVCGSNVAFCQISTTACYSCLECFKWDYGIPVSEPTNIQGRYYEP